MTRSALVTGATGFIGGHLARTLVAEGWAVSALQRTATADSPASRSLRDAGVELVLVDDGAAVQRAARDAGAEVVFHLATNYLKSHSPDDIPGLIDANVTFGTHLLEGLRDSSAAIVSALSFFQFSGGQPTPVSLYSATKQAFLDVSAYYREVLGLDITQVVLYDTYGPGDSRDKLVPHLLAAARASASVSLGPGAQPLDLLYVDDVVAGLRAAAESRAPILALRAPELVTVADVVAGFGELAGAPLQATFNDDAPLNDLVSRSGDWAAPSGWTGGRSLREGLERTWALG